MSSTVIAADFAAIYADMAAVFDADVEVAFGGVTVAGLRTSVRKDEQVLGAGNQSAAAFAVTVDPAAWANPPAAGQTVEISGTAYRVLRTHDRGAGALLKLHLGDQYTARR